MTGLELITIISALQQLSTEIVFILINYNFAEFVMAMVFGLDLMIILMTILVQKVVMKHLTIRPMGERLGLTPYYTRYQLSRMEQIFEVGLAAEYPAAYDRHALAADYGFSA